MTVKEVTYKEILHLLIQMEDKKINWKDVSKAITSYTNLKWEDGYELGMKHGKQIGKTQFTH